MGVLIGAARPAQAAGKIKPPANVAVEELPLRDLLQLPIATINGLTPAQKDKLRERIEKERDAQSRFVLGISLPKKTAVPPGVAALLPETIARVFALDLARRKQGRPPVLVADRRGEQLHQLPTQTLFSKYHGSHIRRDQIELSRTEYQPLLDDILNLVNGTVFFSSLSNGRSDKLALEVVASAPFGVIFSVPDRTIYVNGVLVALIPPSTAAKSSGSSSGSSSSSGKTADADQLLRELTDEKPTSSAAQSSSDDDASSADLGSGTASRRPVRDAAPCWLGTLCISCGRTSCHDCGCGKSLDSFCASCDNCNRDCSRSCTQCNNDCTACNNNCSRNCTSCNNDCNRCNNDCNKCNSDCNSCNNDCNRCNSDCNSCNNDCNRCNNDCNSCNNDCGRCNNDCNNCGGSNCGGSNCGGGGCNNCQVAAPIVPLMPPPLPDARGLALSARAARDSLALSLPPVFFLFWRGRLARRRRSSEKQDPR